MAHMFFGKSSAYSICLVIPLLVGGSVAKAEDVPEFRSDIIMQVPLGKVESRNYALRATITTMQPFAKIPLMSMNSAVSGTCSKGRLQSIGRTAEPKRSRKDPHTSRGPARTIRLG